MLCVQVSGDGFTALHLAAAFGASLCLSQRTATHTHPPTRTHEHKKTCIHARAHTHTHWMYMWVAATVCWITRASSTGPQRARTSARLHARSHTRTHSRARDYTRDRTHAHAHTNTHTRTRTRAHAHAHTHMGHGVEVQGTEWWCQHYWRQAQMGSEETGMGTRPCSWPPEANFRAPCTF
jgi:hypothetical protein